MVRYSEMARPAVRVLNRGGRPTRGEAERRQEHLIETAGAMFMKFGFDGTSIDAVAEAACMSKRTVYARYRDKNELFSAVLRNLIDRWLVPIDQFQLGTRELEPMLMEIGRHLLTSALAPQVVSLHRIIVGESERRPEFGLLAIRAIAAVLKRQGSKLRVNDFERAAEQFISLVVDNGLRLAAFGIGPAPHEVEGRVRQAVDLFLHGVCSR